MSSFQHCPDQGIEVWHAYLEAPEKPEYPKLLEEDCQSPVVPKKCPEASLIGGLLTPINNPHLGLGIICG